MMSLSEDIKQKAIELGFDAVGIAPAREAKHAAAFTDWLARGYAGGMLWLGREPGRRLDPASVLPSIRSIVVVGVSYHVQEPPPGLWNDPLRGRIARFAWGSDYHEVLLPRLRALAQFVGSCNAKAYTDSGPLLERDIAASAGLGFVGRNTMFIRPRMGSLVLLGELLLDVELEYDAADAGPGNPCGNCRRCLDACPTGAFVDEYVLDASNCISYLTIENKGSIPEGLRRKMGNWIFGCDECQVVCPWVRRYSRPSARPFLSWDPDRCAPELAELLQMDEAAFRRRFAGTPVLRAKRRGLLRNAAVALGNSGDASALPILRRAQEDAEPLVREHAAWAEAAILAAK